MKNNLASLIALTLWLVVSPIFTQAALAQMSTLQASIGYGRSFGGIGAEFQWNISPMFALHAGAGYLPKRPVKGVPPYSLFYAPNPTFPGAAGYEAGIKLYLYRATHDVPFSPFFDLEYGALEESGELHYREPGLGFSAYIHDDELYGPSALFGLEMYPTLYLGQPRIGLVAAAGVSYFSNLGTLERRLPLFGFDAGLTFAL